MDSIAACGSLFFLRKRKALGKEKNTWQETNLGKRKRQMKNNLEKNLAQL